MNFLEDMERDRVDLRIKHILQFYTIPKIEKITGKNGKEITELVYRDVKLSNVELTDGRKGNKIIKIVGKSETRDENKIAKIADDLSVLEEMGEEVGVPTEALAIKADTMNDYNFSVNIVKNSSYQQNQILDQAQRMEYANWRLSIAQISPVDANELIKWVDESYDIDTERFLPKKQENAEQIVGQGGVIPENIKQENPQNPQQGPANQLKGSSIQKLSTILGT